MVRASSEEGATGSFVGVREQLQNRGVDAIARAVRIYGAGSTRPAPTDQSFVAESFPQPGDRCSIYLGSIPSSIDKELRQRDAFVTAVMPHVHRR
jgi:hypothetical protein